MRPCIKGQWKYVLLYKKNSDVLSKLKDKGFQVASLSTYEFSTLYTTLPHTLIKEKLDLIERTYRGAIQKFVDKCKEINSNPLIRLKIYEHKSSYHYERYSKFHSKIQTYNLIICN